MCVCMRTGAVSGARRRLTHSRERRGLAEVDRINSELACTVA